MNWRHVAACRNMDPELFFPLPEATDSIARAKAVCEMCPVRRECLVWAIDTGQDAGVWGGRTEDERRNARARWIVPREVDNRVERDSIARSPR